jgi:mRNA-degrading endonuclease toxin of MazEF toxin-antitoxin module
VIQPGDVLLLNFPFSASEDKPFKKRPVLVLGGPSGRGIEEAFLVAMVTGSGDRLANPRDTDVRLDHIGAGLRMPSVVRANRIWAAESRDVAEVLGKVTLEELEQVQSAFRKAFGL